jgi:hypothetical protein
MPVGFMVVTPRCLAAGHVRVPSGFEQAVALSQWHIQRFSLNQYGLAARLRSSGLDETDMTARKCLELVVRSFSIDHKGPRLTLWNGGFAEVKLT